METPALESTDSPEKAFINAHVLKYSDPTKQLIIQTDAHKDRGVCLLQKTQSVTL